MTIPFRVKLLTPTAKLPHRNCESDLWDLFADDFDFSFDYDNASPSKNFDSVNDDAVLKSGGRILVKTGIAIELPVLFNEFDMAEYWAFNQDLKDVRLKAYAVADIRPRSVEILERGLFVESKIIRDGEVSFIVINHGHKPITLTRGQSIAKMLIKPIYPTTMKIVDREKSHFGTI